MQTLKLPTGKRSKLLVAQKGKLEENQTSAIDDLLSELRTNEKLFFELSTNPANAVSTFKGLNENQKMLLEVINPSDLINIGIKEPGSVQACGGSCGASCAGSCGGSCGASCGGSCGGSCGASCVGSCVGSCAGSCAGSCVGSGAIVAQDEWMEGVDELGGFRTNIELVEGINKEIVQFSSFLRSAS